MNLQFENRFWKKVNKNTPNGCWEWVASKKNQGYGQFRGYGGKTVYAHRVAYELLVGPIPEGLHLDHLCRNRACCNPLHLEPVTCRENILRGVGPSAREAAQTHCVHGHEYTNQNTIIFKNSRHCRECKRIDNNKRYHRKRSEAAAEQLGMIRAGVAVVEGRVL